MIKQSELIRTIQNIDTWFKGHQRLLPWREEPSLYRVWISEVMLQQTQVVSVIPYFNRFLKKFPTVEKLAKASEGEVLKEWAGLGYYSRARNIHRSAQLIVANGFPDNKEGWMSLPGVGPYTAGAIVSISLNQPEPILDGNVERVFSRIYRLKRSLKTYRSRLWKTSEVWVKTGYENKTKPSNLNQALMELGATICQPKNPNCRICPISKHCGAFKKGEVKLYPTPKAKTKWIKVNESRMMVIDRNKRVLVRKALKGEWREGLWDLPEMDSRLLRLKRKSGFNPLGKIATQHVVTRHKIRRITDVILMTASKSPPLLNNEAWINPESDQARQMGSAAKRVIQFALERFF